MKISEFKTENHIKEEIRPEYVNDLVYQIRLKDKREFIDKKWKKLENNYNNNNRNEFYNNTFLLFSNLKSFNTYPILFSFYYFNLIMTHPLYLLIKNYNLIIINSNHFKFSLSF